jgi:NADH dehydrogenase (ubiquinone) 1 alpha/beta subcomplex 1
LTSSPLQLLATYTAMFRTALLRSAARAASRPVLRTPFAAPRAAVVPRVHQMLAVRMYSAAGSLNKGEVEGRIMSLLQGFDKVRSDMSPPPLDWHGEANWCPQVNDTANVRN